MPRAAWVDIEPPPLPAASRQHLGLARLLQAIPSSLSLLQVVLIFFRWRHFKKGLTGEAQEQVPAVAGALFSWDHVSGDPAQWVQVCLDLDELKAAIRPRNIKLLLLVMVLQSDDISEDCLIALWKRAEVDSKYLLRSFSTQ